MLTSAVCIAKEEGPLWRASRLADQDCVLRAADVAEAIFVDVAVLEKVQSVDHEVVAADEGSVNARAFDEVEVPGRIPDAVAVGAAPAAP